MRLADHQCREAWTHTSFLLSWIEEYLPGRIKGHGRSPQELNPFTAQRNRPAPLKLSPEHTIAALAAIFRI